MKVKNSLWHILAVIFLITLIAGCSYVQSQNDKNISIVNSTDGRSIAYGVRGQGDITIVFVHCWTCNHEFWKPQIDFFSRKHKVVWLDLAGHGLSKSNRQKYTMTAFAEDVVAVVNEISSDNIILVGHSMGGPVAIEAAKILGNKVIGIVGVDTFYTSFEYPKSELKIDGFIKPFKDNFKATSEQLIRSMFTAEADPELVTSIVKQMSATNQEMGISAMYEIFRWNAKNVPGSLNNFAIKLRNINSAATEKEVGLHKSVVLIPGAGHFIAQVKPNKFNQALSTIIREFRVH